MPVASSSRARLMAQEATKASLDPALAAAGAEAQAAQAATPLDSLTTVLGSANGATLRQIARDLDSTRLLLDLAAPAGRPARRLAVQVLSAALFGRLEAAARRVRAFGGEARRLLIVPGGGAAAAAPARPAQPQPWPSSAEATRLEERAAARAKKAGWLLLRSHVARQVGAGWRGAAAASALVYVTARVCLAAVVRTLARACGACLTAALPASVGVRAAAASAAVASWASRELAALGHSAGEVAEEMELKGLELRAKGAAADGEPSQ